MRDLSMEGLAAMIPHLRGVWPKDEEALRFVSYYFARFNYLQVDDIMRHRQLEGFNWRVRIASAMAEVVMERRMIGVGP